jgi:hypothetical protein
VLGDLATSFEAVMRFAAATAAALVPRRYWPSVEEHLPITQAALASAVATLALAGVIAVPAFFRHSEASADRAVEAMLQSSGWRTPAPGSPPPSSSRATATWVTSYLAFFSFAFFTPVGLFSTYLGLSAVVRAVCVAADEPMGDPLLTAVDAVARRGSYERRMRRARLSRERLEGPEVADRLVPAPAAGFADADVVVVASRQKPEWTAGAFVITSEKWYRLGHPVERLTPGGLRTLYPLTELRDREVVRRGIHYELPPPSASFSKPD